MDTNNAVVSTIGSVTKIDSKVVLENALNQLNEIILDKDVTMQLAITCLLAKGHLLLEDVPGTGKTVLAHALAGVFGLDYKRVQFTNDLLPADIMGVSIYDRNTSSFSFHKGPVFTQLLLADEINRATPKSQSALLEAMEEHQVSLEGETHLLPNPFFVIATQNPLEQQGTYPLPEAQLDRFLMRLSLGYPSKEAELEILGGKDRREMLAELVSSLSVDELVTLQGQVNTVHVSRDLLKYIQALLDHTRNSGLFVSGLSPRAGLSLVRASRAWALLQGAESVIPAHVQAVYASIASHRLQAREGVLSGEQIGQLSLDAVDIP